MPDRKIRVARNAASSNSRPYPAAEIHMLASGYVMGIRRTATALGSLLISICCICAFGIDQLPRQAFNAAYAFYEVTGAGDDALLL